MIQRAGVIVPAHNEEQLLPACLASLREAAAVSGTGLELVVVADACRDRTAQVAREGGASVITVDARNVGVARAAGADWLLRRTVHLPQDDVWLATTDADTIVPRSWLAAQVAYADQGWDAAVGTVTVPDWSGYQPETPERYREFYGDGAGPHAHVHGANLGFRASAYLAAGGFPPLATAEDHALVAALTRAGCRVLRTRSLTVVTSARREHRAPRGFGHYLAQLDAAAAGTPSPGQEVSPDYPLLVPGLGRPGASPVRVSAGQCPVGGEC